MKKIFLCFCFLSRVVTGDAQNIPANRNVPFDEGWRFAKGIITANEPKFDDAKWRTIDLPHDWSIEDLPAQIPDSIVGPFSKGAISQRDGGFTVGGTGWYRKHFSLDKSALGKKVFIQFDGVYMNADVWINGHHLGNHPYGYTSFYYELTQYLKPAGLMNVIAVQVKNEGVNSRWYSGSGIYRHVWLTIVNPPHIDTWGTYVTTPSVSSKEATVTVQTTLQNNHSKAPFELLADIYSPSGKLVGSCKKEFVSASDNISIISQTITVANPSIWSLETPALYTARVKILQQGKVMDETTTPFGIRSIHFDTQTGFTLNGNNIKLHGGCIHHDNGPLGAAAIDRAEERKIELLKKQGYNAIRMSHNPPSPQLLDACDRMGMLVIDEAFDMWEQAKNTQDYHLYFNDWWHKDLQSMILRDRNHPSIIMWSIGNEIPEAVDSSGYATSKRLSEAVRRLDTTRPVTMAIPLFVTLGKKGKTWDDTAPSYSTIGVAGYNYASSKYESDHTKFPNRVMYASEYFPNKGIDNWLKVEALPYVIGTFSWTAMDYLGEAGLGAPRLMKQDTGKVQGGLFGGPGSDAFLKPCWPIFNAYTGEMDLIGDKKVNSYYLDVVWKRSEVEMLVHPPIPEGYKEANFFYNFPSQLKSWSFPGEDEKKLQVFIYSRAKKVTLELNGKLIGEQIVPPNITAVFDVPYEPGTLIARSFDNDKQTGADTLRTVGNPVAIRLRADRNSIGGNRNDLCYIHVDVVDEKGMVVPYVDDLEITYQLTGNATIAGVGNGNPADMSSFQQNHKKVYQGRGLVIVRPNGMKGIVHLKAKAKGLKADSVHITMK